MKRYYFDSDRHITAFFDFFEGKGCLSSEAIYEFSPFVSSKGVAELLGKKYFSCPVVVFSRELGERLLQGATLLKSKHDFDIALRLTPSSPECYRDIVGRDPAHLKKNNVYTELNWLSSKFGLDPSHIEFDLNDGNIDLLFSSLMAAEELKVHSFFLRTINLSPFSRASAILDQLDLFRMYSLSNDYSLDLAGDDGLEIFWKYKIGGDYFALEHLDLDVSNKCTHSCLFCAVYSPEVIENKKKEHGAEHFKLYTDFMKKTAETEKIINMIDQNQRGLRRVTLSGVGDPFLHPEIVPIMKHIAGKGIEVHVCTNFDYISEDQIRELTSIGDKTHELFHITVNLSAASSEIYAKVRPRQNESDYRRVYKKLSFAGNLRQIHGKGMKLTIQSVLNNINFRELPLYPFVVIDLGASDFFPKPLEIHSDEMVKYKIESYEDIFEQARLAKLCLYFSDMLRVPIRGRELLENKLARFSTELKDYEENKLSFEEQVISFLSENGLDIESYKVRSRNIWINSQARQEEIWPFCRKDQLRDSDLRFKENDTYSDLMPVNVKDGESYAQAFYSKNACYISDVYARVLVDGKVLPCCASKYPIGNINKSDFKSIRSSRAIELFKKTTETFPESRKFNSVSEWSFCKSCPHIQINKRLNFFKSSKPLIKEV